MPDTHAENALAAAYALAQYELEQQPEDDRGAVVVLAIVGEDMKAHAYGSPAMWAKMLFGVAIRNEDFRLALHIATCRINDALDDDRDY